MKEQKDFYLLDEKFNYSFQGAIVANPIISSLSPAKFSDNDRGTKVCVQEFEMDGYKFTAIMTSFFDRGPIRGYKRFEILKEGQTIILYEAGGKGHGTNYRKGSPFFIAENNIYLIEKGSVLKHCKTGENYEGLDSEKLYFFWFKELFPLDASGLER